MVLDPYVVWGVLCNNFARAPLPSYCCKHHETYRLYTILHKDYVALCVLGCGRPIEVAVV